MENRGLSSLEDMLNKSCISNGDFKNALTLFRPGFFEPLYGQEKKNRTPKRRVAVGSGFSLEINFLITLSSYGFYNYVYFTDHTTSFSGAGPLSAVNPTWAGLF